CASGWRRAGSPVRGGAGQDPDDGRCRRPAAGGGDLAERFCRRLGTIAGAEGLAAGGAALTLTYPSPSGSNFANANAVTSAQTSASNTCRTATSGPRGRSAPRQRLNRSPLLAQISWS